MIRLNLFRDSHQIDPYHSPHLLTGDAMRGHIDMRSYPSGLKIRPNNHQSQELIIYSTKNLPKIVCERGKGMEGG